MPSKKHFRSLAAALPGVSADGGGEKNKEAAQGQEQALSIPGKSELKYPNLGSHLDGLVIQVEDGETTSQAGLCAFQAA